MPVVRLRGPLKRLAGDRREHPVDGATVIELMAALELGHPAMKGWILDEQGQIRRHVNVFVDGERASLDVSVSPNSELNIIQAISGGT